MDDGVLLAVVEFFGEDAFAVAVDEEIDGAEIKVELDGVKERSGETDRPGMTPMRVGPSPLKRAVGPS